MKINKTLLLIITMCGVIPCESAFVSGTSSLSAKGEGSSRNTNRTNRTQYTPGRYYHAERDVMSLPYYNGQSPDLQSTTIDLDKLK